MQWREKGLVWFRGAMAELGQRGVKILRRLDNWRRCTEGKLLSVLKRSLWLRVPLPLFTSRTLEIHEDAQTMNHPAGILHICDYLNCVSSSDYTSVSPLCLLLTPRWQLLSQTNSAGHRHVVSSRSDTTRPWDLTPPTAGEHSSLSSKIKTLIDKYEV